MLACFRIFGDFIVRLFGFYLCQIIGDLFLELLVILLTNFWRFYCQIVGFLFVVESLLAFFPNFWRFMVDFLDQLMSRVTLC